MTERTYHIIRICKDHSYVGDAERHLKEYIKKITCRTTCRDEELESILREATRDYIDGCDRPSEFLALMDGEGAFVERAIHAFEEVREYEMSEMRIGINGFARFHRNCHWTVRAIENKDKPVIVCSSCREEFVVPEDTNEIERYHFCPNCGRYIEEIYDIRN